MAATKLTKHHLINVPGGFVTLDVYGQEGEGGIPALYIHGGPGGNKKSFQPMAERIAEDRTVYLYDQIGCDDKSHTGEESLWVPERYVEELNAVIAAIGAPKIHLIGRSWGAYLAARHLLETPDSPAISATMISPLFSTKIWIADAKQRLSELGEGRLPEVEICEHEHHFDGYRYREIMAEYDANFRYRLKTVERPGHMSTPLKPKSGSGMNVYHYMWGPSEFTCDGVLKDLDITDAVRGIRIAVLFICGEFDQVRQPTCEYYRSLIPGSRMAIIPDASQTSYLEQPNIFYWTLRNFYECF